MALFFGHCFWILRPFASRVGLTVVSSAISPRREACRPEGRLGTGSHVKLLPSWDARCGTSIVPRAEHARRHLGPTEDLAGQTGQSERLLGDGRRPTPTICSRIWRQVGSPRCSRPVGSRPEARANSSSASAASSSHTFAQPISQFGRIHAVRCSCRSGGASYRSKIVVLRAAGRCSGLARSSRGLDAGSGVFGSGT